MTEPKNQSCLPFRVVGVGASAGGIEALQVLVRALPDKPGIALTVVQHLPPDHQSGLVAILGACTALPVQDATEGCSVEPDRIYVIAPGEALTLERGIFRSRLSAHNRGDQLSMIDNFLDSLATDQHTQAIAVILSGTGSDGAAGVIRIKQGGGITFAQEPTTASHDGMPRAAIGTGAIDWIMAPEAIAWALPHCVPRMGSLSHPAAWSTEMAEALGSILATVRAHADFDFSGYKTTPLVSRIQQRMSSCRITNLAEYALLLRTAPAEVEALVRHLPIHVTAFFRDEEAWRRLEHDVIAPLVLVQDGDRPIRAWTAACATGEEAYSLAMLLDEEAAKQSRRVPFQIFAADASPDIVARASSAVFPATIGENLSAERLERHFEKVPKGYRIRKSLRSKMVFAPHHLLSDPPFSDFDLITCRNLLIYLERNERDRVLSLLNSALHIGGYLFLGQGEPLMPASHGFEPVSARARIYRKIATPAERPPLTMITPARKSSAVIDEQVHRRLLEVATLPSALIDADFEILQVYGDLEPYCVPASGEPVHNLLRVARAEFASELQSVVKHAHETNRTATAHGLTLAGRESEPVELRATPVIGGDRPRTLVSFVQMPHPGQGYGAPPGGRAGLPEFFSQWRDGLYASSEELEASREEMQALNEELTSVNDQLSVANIELTGVNRQLRGKIDELELQHNVLASGGVIALFLDQEVRIRWFTPAIERLFPLRPADVGRPITDFASRFVEGDFIEAIQGVLASGRVAEAEVRTLDGSWYLRGIRPFRAGELPACGVAVTFSEITGQKRAEAKLQETQSQLQADLAGMRLLYDLHATLAADIDLPSALKAILETAVTFAHTDRGTVQLLKRGNLEIVAHCGYDPGDGGYIEHFRHVAFNEGYDEAKKEGKRLIIEDTRTFPGLVGTKDGAVVLADGIFAAQSTPLITRKGEMVGILSTQYRRPYRPSEPELRMLDLLAWTAADFVESQRAEALMRQSDERLKRVLETDAVGVIFFDHSGTLIGANRVFLAMSGYSRAEVEARTLTWRTMTPPEWIETSERQMEQLAATGRIGPYEKEYLRKDGIRRRMLFAGQDLGDGTVVEFAIDLAMIPKAS
jgi:two-component system, chemotaxis family, CheB/CheR fusion protein